MLATSAITGWHWFGFIVCILFFLALDLGVFHRRAHGVQFKEALAWTGIWFALAMLFGLVIAPALVADWQSKQTVDFITGYTLEFSLSMDNVFAIAVIFAYFAIPAQLQHRVLFWGILGALIMRGIMIWLGIELVHRFTWLLFVLGAFLVLSGLDMAFFRKKKADPEKNLVIRCVRIFFPVSTNLDGQRFITRRGNRAALTPLALALVLIETTDLLFALDSIPAIFAVTTDSFIVFTSNVFAILGLRSLYFVLAGAIQYFRHLKVGLAIVLVFIGAKMLLHNILEISTLVSLAIVVLIITTSILASVLTMRGEDKH